MTDLHTVSVYDEEEVAKQPTASPPTLRVLATVPPATTPNDPIYRTTRNAIVSLSATYIAIISAFIFWLVLYDPAEIIVGVIAVTFWFFVAVSAELVLTAVCTALTIAKWQLLPRWVKVVGLFPLIASVGALVVSYATSRGNTAEEEPRHPPSCDPIDLCHEVNVTHFPLHYPKICYFPDSFPEQDCFNSTIDLSSALQGCNFTEICSTILGNETMDG